MLAIDMNFVRVHGIIRRRRRNIPLGQPAQIVQEKSLSSISHQLTPGAPALTGGAFGPAFGGLELGRGRAVALPVEPPVGFEASIPNNVRQ